MKIVITGSLGHISRPLAKQLLKESHTVTIVSSHYERIADIRALGAQSAIGSVEDAEFVTKTFKEADAVYCMTPPNFGKPDQIDYYIQVANAYAAAIDRSGVKRVIYLSSYGANLPSGTGFITGSHKAEQILNAVDGIRVTHMRPTFFYYNLFGFIPMIKTAGFIGAVYGGNDRLLMVSPRDIALAVAEEITKPTGGKVRYVTSDERTCNEIAQVLGRAIGKPDLTWKNLPCSQVLQSLQSNGVPGNVAENLVELGEAIHTGILREDFDRQEHFQGTVSLEEFSNEFTAIYNQTTHYH